MFPRVSLDAVEKREIAAPLPKTNLVSCFAQSVV